VKRALTLTQADALLRAAGLLPLATRDQFITAVDNQLRSRHVTDADLSAAITSALSTLNVTTSHFMCDQEVSMPKYLKFDRNGAPIEDDDDILRDGQRIVVPMNMRDGMSELQRAVAEDKARRGDGIGLVDALALHKPGQRFSVDAAARTHVEQVYQDEKRKLQDAWRTTTVRGQQPGDQCTIDGQPGHLNHRLECVPDQRQDSVMTTDQAQAIKDAAYNAMVAELQNAWRK
jgi:hypothetical protein